MRILCSQRAIRVDELLRISAQQVPDKVAIISDGKYWSYASLEQSSNQFARGLQSIDFQRGDRALIFLPNCVEAVIAFFGIIKAGGIACILHSDMKSAKFSLIANDAKAKFVITSHVYIETINSAQPTTVKKIISISYIDKEIISVIPVILLSELTSNTDVSDFNIGIIDQDIAFLVYTSGSTGIPKGVMCPHNSVISAVNSITQYLKHTSDDVIVNVLPLAFDHGLYQVLLMFYVGGTLLLERNFSLPYATLRRMNEEGVTGIPGVPTVFALLLHLRPQVFLLPKLRYLASTGAPLPVHHIKELQKRFPRAILYSMYGLTECKRVSYLPPEELDRRPSSIGKGMPNEDVWIINEGGERLGPGSIGELVVRGANVMRGYWNRPEETKSVFRNVGEYGERVLYTGDLMKMDEEGFLYFVGRKDDLIKSRGEKIYPKEIEDILYMLPGIAEAAIVGRPDELVGHILIAHIVSEPVVAISAEMVIAFLTSRVESHAIPREVHFHVSLPRTSSGKIDRRALTDLRLSH
jgi:long-chain acyl-CoA synthetase